MTKKTKNILKGTGYWSLVMFIFIIINLSSLTFVVLNFLDKEVITLTSGKELTISFIDSLKNWEIGLIYLFMGIGFLISIFYTKFLYKEIIRKIDKKKQNLILDTEIELKKEALKIEKEKHEMDILKIKAETGKLTDKEMKKLEEILC